MTVSLLIQRSEIVNPEMRHKDSSDALLLNQQYTVAIQITL